MCYVFLKSIFKCWIHGSIYVHKLNLIALFKYSVLPKFLSARCIYQLLREVYKNMPLWLRIYKFLLVILSLFVSYIWILDLLCYNNCHDFLVNFSFYTYYLLFSMLFLLKFNILGQEGVSISRHIYFSLIFNLSFPCFHCFSCIYYTYGCGFINSSCNSITFWFVHIF